ncbi:hypothetical protein EVAR_24874_1 [Eumeta japonica]|uniref:Uncharacterized protein n=1 Tax=Eumeta variegata TaxID=151549 RepID=A0A4C1V636_EUMVA|nr:hypothetical protein EVAR_24874_1 [Eumeta japonica]
MRIRPHGRTSLTIIKLIVIHLAVSGTAIQQVSDTAIRIVLYCLRLRAHGSIPSSLILNDLVVNPNSVLRIVPDFDPGYALNSNPGLTLAFNSVLIFDVDPGAYFYFCPLPRLQF